MQLCIVCDLIQNGQTVLHRAAIGGHMEVVDHLLKLGADIHVGDNVSQFIVLYVCFRITKTK